MRPLCALAAVSVFRVTINEYPFDRGSRRLLCCCQRMQRKSDYRTPLHVAVQRGLFEAARRLIELGADINAVAKVPPYVALNAER